MRVYRILPVLGAGLLALAACAPPEPQPIRPEPVYNKFGDVIGGCIPAGRTPQSTFEQSLPICEPECPPGQTAAGADLDYCIPIPGDDDDQNGRRGNDNQSFG